MTRERGLELRLGLPGTDEFDKEEASVSFRNNKRSLSVSAEAGGPGTGRSSGRSDRGAAPPASK